MGVSSQFQTKIRVWLDWGSMVASPLSNLMDWLSTKKFMPFPTRLCQWALKSSWPHTCSCPRCWCSQQKVWSCHQQQCLLRCRCCYQGHRQCRAEDEQTLRDTSRSQRRRRCSDCCNQHRVWHRYYLCLLRNIPSWWNANLWRDWWRSCDPVGSWFPGVCLPRLLRNPNCQCRRLLEQLPRQANSWSCHLLGFGERKRKVAEQKQWTARGESSLDHPFGSCLLKRPCHSNGYRVVFASDKCRFCTLDSTQTIPIRTQTVRKITKSTGQLFGGHVWRKGPRLRK